MPVSNNDDPSNTGVSNMDTIDRDAWTLVASISALRSSASVRCAALPACIAIVSRETWRARQLDGRRQNAAGRENATIAMANTTILELNPPGTGENEEEDVEDLGGRQVRDGTSGQIRAVIGR